MTGQPPVFRILGVPVSATSPAWVDDRVRHLVVNRELGYICVFAVDSILQCLDHPDFLGIAEKADMVLPDGMPLVRLGRARGLAVERCYGPDLMARMCRDGVRNGFRHFFYGGTPDMLDQLRTRLEEEYPGIVIAGMMAPPFRELTAGEEQQVAEEINTASPDIVWVGLGTLKQERWMARMRSRLQPPLLIGVGAAFPFHAGVVPQAPRWMMACALEWLFRLWAEPRRLWRRYLLGNPRFVWLLARDGLGRAWGRARGASGF